MTLVLVALLFAACDAVDSDELEGAPRIVGPVTDTLFAASDRITLEWEPVLGADQYLVEVATGLDFSDLAYTGTQQELTVELPELSPDTYYWRIFAQTSDNETSLPSEVRSFRVEELAALRGIVTFEYILDTGPVPAATLVEVGSDNLLDIEAMLEEEDFSAEDIIAARIVALELGLFDAPLPDLSLVVERFTIQLTGGETTGIEAVALPGLTGPGNIWTIEDLPVVDFSELTEDPLLGSVFVFRTARVLPGGTYRFVADLDVELIVADSD